MELSFNDLLPASVKKAMTILEGKGYKAYLVGGAIRDLAMKKVPHDYDLTTEANYEEINQVFKDQGFYSKNFKHDTVNVHFSDMDIEVTSFRGDDPTSLKDDLEKRDFTINSLAYSLKEGLIDDLDSLSDIKDKIIRASYGPDDDFKDDPLRILRGIRFSGQFNFAIEKKTNSSLRKLAPLIKTISPERIGAEFLKILVLPCSDRLIKEYFDVFTSFIPELQPMEGFNQHSAYHEYDVLDHSLMVLRAIKDRNPALCLAALFHDIGKPHTFFMKNGSGHFYGHDEYGAELTKTILTRLKYPNSLIEEVCSLIKHHMAQMGSKKAIKRLMNKLGNSTFKELIELREADIKGCNERNKGPFLAVEKIKESYQEILSNKECFSLKYLAISGNDLIALGMKPSKELGNTLKELLNEVEEDKLPNDKNSLLKAVNNLKKP